MDIHVERLLRLIECVKQPIWIPVEPAFSASFDNCFYNVENHILQNDGSIVYGWKIHRSQILLEAERHAVWNSTKGNLIDITPDKFKRSQIQFLEDESKWEFTGEMTDNVRINVTQNQLVDDYILLAQTITSLWKTGKRSSPIEIRLLAPIAKMITILEDDLLSRENWIQNGATYNDYCYCGKPARYVDCHGYDLKNQFMDTIAWAKEMINSK